MARPLGIAASLFLLGGLAGNSALGVVTVTCTPSNITPTGNEVVDIECKMSTNVQFTINSYRLTYPCAATLSGGASGSVDHLAIPPTTCTFGGSDPDCNFGGFQGSCNGIVCFSSAQCGGGPCVDDPSNPGVRYCEDLGTCAAPSPFIDTTRTDYLFRGVSGVTASSGTGTCPGTPPFVAGNAPGGTGHVFLVGEQLYVGTFRYRVSTCAGGSFTLNVVGNSTPPLGSDATRAVSTGGVPQQVSGSASGVSIDAGVCCDGNSCVGNFNPYCCIHLHNGLLTKPEASCTPPNPNNCDCTTDAHCNDFNPCTNDVCAPGNPASDAVGCVHANNVPSGYCCDPTGVGPLQELDDNNPCTLDFCENGTYPAIHDAAGANNELCQEDGNACTLDLCNNGQCVHDAAGANGADCASDGNPCTVDSCNNGTCTHSASAANGLRCQSDGVFCTFDVCNGGACTHPNINTFACELPSDCPSLCASSQSGCTGSIGNPGLCVCIPPSGPCYGDIYPAPNGNGSVDIDDILCSLDEFVANGLCPQADIFPCGGDGAMDVDDILAMLDAFAGFAHCGCPCG